MVACPLVPGLSRLVSGSYSSPRAFVSRFLQTPPHGDALALPLSFASTWLDRGLSPPSVETCPAHTPQKPTQRTRIGELPEDLSGSILERGRRGEKRQARGRPVGFRLRAGRVVRHTDLEPRQGKPGHGRRPEPTRHAQRPQPVSGAEQKRGELKTQRESDPPLVLRDGNAGYTGKGRTAIRSLQRKH